MHVTKFGLYFRSVWETTVFVSQILIVANFLSIVNQVLAAGSSTRSSYNTFLCASKRILATAGLVTLTQRVLGHTVFAVEELPSVLRRVPATRRLCTSCATDQLHQDEPTSCRLHASRPLPKRVCRVLQVWWSPRQVSRFGVPILLHRLIITRMDLFTRSNMPSNCETLLQEGGLQPSARLKHWGCTLHDFRRMLFCYMGRNAFQDCFTAVYVCQP